MNLRAAKKEREKAFFDKLMDSVLENMDTEQAATAASSDSAMDVDVHGPKADVASDYDVKEQARKGRINSTSAEIVKRLKAFPSETDTLDVPAVLARVFEAFGYKDDIANNHLESTANAYMANELRKMVPDMLKLCDWVHEQGYTEKSKWDLGFRDRYAFSLANEPDLKVLVGIRQSDSFLLLLENTTEHSPNWEVHIRHMPNYAPNLEALKLSDFVTDDDQSDRKFRYLDARDEGYLASTSSMGNHPFVDCAMAGYYKLVGVTYAIRDLLMAMDEETTPASGKNEEERP